MIHLQTPKKSILFPQQSNQSYSSARDESTSDSSHHNASFSGSSSNGAGVSTSGSGVSGARFTLPPLSSILSSAKSNHYKDHPLTNITNTTNNSNTSLFVQTPCKKLPAFEPFTSTPLATATPYIYQQSLPHAQQQQQPQLQHQQYPAPRSASSSLPRPSPPLPPQPQHYHSYITYQPIHTASTSTASTTTTHSNVSSSTPTPPPSASTSLVMSSRKRSNSIIDEDTSLMDTSILELRKSKTKPKIKSISTSPSTTTLSLATPISATAGSSEKLYAFISHSPATFPSQEPDIDNAPLARRKRRRTSPHELNILNKEFELGSTPNKARRIEIAKVVHMTEKAVQIWFQNKRQALRKQSNVEKEILELPPTDVPIHQQHVEQQLQQQKGQLAPIPTATTSHIPLSAHSQEPAPIVSSTPTKPIKSNLSIMMQ